MEQENRHSETIQSGPRLVRVLGRWDLTALGVNQVIGSGIFVLPATVAALVGQGASPLVWIAAAFINTVIILCFARAAAHFRETGGPYLYARTAFGSFPAFQVAWMMWLTRVSSQAALANAFAIYLGYLWAGATQGWGRILVVSIVIVVLAGINLGGVRQGSWTVNSFTVGKLVPLGAFVLLGIGSVRWERFEGFWSPEWGGLGQATLLLMFAFGGYELIPLPAGEARSPRKDAPAALLATIAIVSLLYLLIQIVAVGTLEELARSETPLADSAQRFMGPIAGTLIALGGLISIGGANAGTMLAGPRVTFALAEGRHLPRLFAHVHPRFRTPDFSIIIYATVSLLLALSGTFIQMAAVSAVARLVFYATTCASVLVLERKGEDELEQGFLRLLSGPLIPILGVACSLMLIGAADAFALSAGGIALLAGTVIHFGYRFKSRQSVN